VEATGTRYLADGEVLDRWDTCYLMRRDGDGWRTFLMTDGKAPRPGREEWLAWLGGLEHLFGGPSAAGGYDCQGRQFHAQDRQRANPTGGGSHPTGAPQLHGHTPGAHRRQSGLAGAGFSRPRHGGIHHGVPELADAA